MEADAIEAAIRRPDLILASDILGEDLLLDADRLAGEIPAVEKLAAQRRQRIDEPDAER